MAYSQSFSPLCTIYHASLMFLALEAEYIFLLHWYWAWLLGLTWAWACDLLWPLRYQKIWHEWRLEIYFVFWNVFLWLSLFTCFPIFYHEKKMPQKAAEPRRMRDMWRSPGPSLQLGVKSSWAQPKPSEPQLIFRCKREKQMLTVVCLWVYVILL